MIDDNGHYTADEVARLVFDHDVRWFQRNRKKLERREGFPRPISPIGRPRWLGAKLRAWVARPDLPVVGPHRGVVDFDEVLRKRLRSGNPGRVA